jgi:hypothetical protein
MSEKNVALINVALSCTVGGYYALTKESVQDIRWSMQGYRKTLVFAIKCEAMMLNMLQRLVKFSSKFFGLKNIHRLRSARRDCRRSTAEAIRRSQYGNAENLATKRNSAIQV